MFGIRGLDPFGLAHALLGVAALILGLALLLRRKGTPVHRRIGQAYVLSMLLLNITALMIYDLYGRSGRFTWLPLSAWRRSVLGSFPCISGGHGRRGSTSMRISCVGRMWVSWQRSCPKSPLGSLEADSALP